MTEEYREVEKIAREIGFLHTAYLDSHTIVLREEVRDMCKANTCGQYENNWACPPHCGDLDSCRKKVAEYRWGILFQTVGELEDSMDFEGIHDTEVLHKEAYMKLIEKLREKYPGLLALGAGCCTICKKCAYPEPCRFPERRVSSMEAFGIVVSDLCTANNIKYYYGPSTIAYTSCCLLG